MNIILDDDLLNFIGKQESQFLVSPIDLLDQVKTKINSDQNDFQGLQLPWSKTHSHVRIRTGEVSLWAGINGHGKSGLVGQVCAWGMREKWLIASMEMPPTVTVERILKQIAGTATPDDFYIDKIIHWMNDKLWLYDQTDTVGSDRILALVRYAKALGIQHVIIDSLIKCGIAKKDMEGQAQFVDRLCWLAKTNGVHIHLVHHMRKTDSEKQRPGKFDIRGASEITDLVDNIFIIFRNKKKEEKHLDDEEPDCFLEVAKQRHFPWEGIFKLYFNKQNYQYTAHPDRIMNHWLNV